MTEVYLGSGQQTFVSLTLTFHVALTRRLLVFSASIALVGYQGEKFEATPPRSLVPFHRLAPLPVRKDVEMDPSHAHSRNPFDSRVL